MCGRYFTRQQKQELAERLRAGIAFDEPFPANFNIAPTTRAPFLRANPETGKPELVMMYWSKQKFDKSLSTFNAKGERLLESPLWRPMLERRRGAIPMSGFYEFVDETIPTPEATEMTLFGNLPKTSKRKKDKIEKRAFAFGVKGSDLYLAGGLWDTVKTPDGKIVEWFTIITTNPNSMMEGFHDRMPWILDDSTRDLWLNSAIGTDRGDLQMLASLVRTYDADKMDITEVNPAVGKPINNGPEMLIGPRSMKKLTREQS